MSLSKKGVSLSPVLSLMSSGQPFHYSFPMLSLFTPLHSLSSQDMNNKQQQQQQQQQTTTTKNILDYSTYIVKLSHFGQRDILLS